MWLLGVVLCVLLVEFLVAFKTSVVLDRFESLVRNFSIVAALQDFWATFDGSRFNKRAAKAAEKLKY